MAKRVSLTGTNRLGWLVFFGFLAIADGFADAQQVAKTASSVTSWHDYPVRDWQGKYRGFVPRADVAADQSLDHVIANAGIEVLRHRVVRHPVAMDVSDHSPVVVDFRVKGK